MANKFNNGATWLMPYTGGNENAEFGTLSELRAWANRMGVPSNAKVVYEGCGTHNIAFEWPKTDDELAAARHNSIFKDNTYASS